MAPSRKKSPAATAEVHELSAPDLTTQKASLGQPAFREFKLRLPHPVAERIATKAKARGTPQSRVIIEELTAIPDLENRASFSAMIEEMRDVLSRFGARAAVADLSDNLLAAVDAVLKAKGTGTLQAAMDRLRVVRTEMRKHESASN